MIIWLTGQSGSGKTTLANELQKNALPNAFRIDGDDLRALFKNKDYSKGGRMDNVRTAQRIARYLNNQGMDVIVSLVSPFRFQRDRFKEDGDVVEVYVHYDKEKEVRGREHFYLSDYEKPIQNFIEVDTTNKIITETLNNLLHEIRTFHR